MRASVLLLVAFLALAFVVTYAADEEEVDEVSVSENEDKEDLTVDGARSIRRDVP
ncbi:hypothetical protein NP493_2230g00005 [Ridgeia piscesae]|uniref:Uncharacterized protein n=1 Tax=Ridgeia piscesae TaxID=27915 RepID=A0AAD9N3F7_RIDPI|nr:hypothetical protein NP493_2230g00005 [Ridgeia piscesae]